MIETGFAIDNPMTGSHTVVLEGNGETDGGGWLLEHRAVPHRRPDIPEHIHLTWTETFEIIAGSAFYSLDGVQGRAEVGDVIVVGPRQRHIHPWNAGETDLVYRQRDQFEPPDPTATQEVLGVFATVADLARQGKVGEDGRVKNPLQQAVMLKVLNRHGGYDASIPIWLQDALGATLGSLAGALGYRAIDPRYAQSFSGR
jgi:mannose-6-phosphate isomerase-like protein (cupin superfamily)